MAVVSKLHMYMRVSRKFYCRSLKDLMSRDCAFIVFILVGADVIHFFVVH